MESKAHLTKSLGIALAFFLSAISPSVSRSAELGPLPFDHRRLLLVQMDKTEIPKAPVLAQILDDMRVRGRYQWVLASRPGEPVAAVMVPRDFSWDSPPSVKKMAERYNVDGVLWIQQRDQEILLKWFDGKEGLPLVYESTFLRADAKEAAQSAQRISTWIASIWARFPGVGFVAKRDAKYLYFEGAEENSLKPGDIVKILRVESATRHKLFKTLAEFQTSQVGMAKVVSVDKLLAKAEVTEESSLDPVKMGDRYEPVATQMVESKSAPAAATPSAQAPNEVEGDRWSSVFNTNGKLGAAALFIGYGQSLHNEKTVDGVNPELKRNAPALEAEAMMFITNKWLAWANYRYRFATFTNPPAAYSLDSINARVTSMALTVGHRFMLEESTGLWVAPFIGYRTYGFTAGEQNSQYGPSSKKWNAPVLGVHLEFPFDDRWLLRVVGSRSIFISYSEKDDLSGGAPRPSASELGATLWLKLGKDNSLGGGFRYQSLSTQYNGVGTVGRVEAKSVTLKVSELRLGYESRF
ncbi:MAG TPA: hypothetical protein VM901_01740 [Bdellovibrionota bacterium]|nr:hypothetical protein [Bdellovibrionota bacterium]